MQILVLGPSGLSDATARYHPFNGCAHACLAF